MAWPVEYEELKDDLGIPAEDTRDDERLKRVLGAAVEFVERVRPEFNYVNDPLTDAPPPSADLELGTLRLAGRWHTRRRSPDGLLQMAELGAARVPSFDPDIDRLLGLGRYRKAAFA